jgi:hypothetical protein
MTQGGRRVRTPCPVEGPSLEDLYGETHKVSEQLGVVLRELKEIKQSILELSQAVDEREQM